MQIKRQIEPAATYIQYFDMKLGGGGGGGGVGAGGFGGTVIGVINSFSQEPIWWLMSCYAY
jgi:hypothetical protein